MKHEEQPLADSEVTTTNSADPFTAGEAVLARAKSISQLITERVRELTRDTEGHTVLPNEPTDVQPPLAD